jgi:peptidyl-prolyl cis-trans isomerase D
MFENLHRRRKNMFKYVVTWAIFGAIILVFVLWGAGSRLSNTLGSGAGAAAHVNSELITLADVSEAVENLQRNPYLSQLAQGEDGLKRVQMLAVNELVNEELRVQVAQKEGFRASDLEVRDTIMGFQAFNQDGKFQRERYNMYLEHIHSSPAEFETKLRREELVVSAEQALRAGLVPSKLEVAKQQELSKMKANLEFVAVNEAKLAAATPVSSAEVQAFLAKKDNQTPISDYFNLHKADFSTEEQVHARHILIKAAKTDATAVAKARSKIEEIEKRLKNKEDFAKLAKELSEDPGSKAAGGDLGFFSKDKMVPEFANAAFALRVGEISAPVQTDFGYHLIEVIEKHAAVVATLESKKAEIAKQLIEQERTQAVLTQLKDLLKKKNLAAVNAWVQAHGLKWDETGVFSFESERIPKIGTNPQVSRLAFTLSASAPLAEELVRQGSLEYLVRYKEVSAANGKSAAKKSEDSLLENADYLSGYLANQRSQEAFRRWVSEARKTAKISINPAIGENTTGPQDAPPF